MAEAEKYVFSYREIVTQLVKAQGIHEGIWSLYLEFGIQGANIGLQIVNGGVPTDQPDGPPTEVVPSAIIPVQKIGIARTTHLSNIAVDAAEVNPKPKEK